MTRSPSSERCLTPVRGRGADGNTCACDAAHDGVTNPKPINGNKRRSYSADDGGGFFRNRAKNYYAHKALPLPS